MQFFFKLRQEDAKRKQKGLIHEKIVDSINSCQTLDQLKTCRNFSKLPCMQDDQKKERLNLLIKFKRQKLLFNI